MTDARTLTAALRGRWHGRYGLAFCPAHPNTRTPALSLADGRDGRLLAKCFAGCSFTDIVEALRGLGMNYGQTAPDPAGVARREKADREAQQKRIRQALLTWEESEPAHGTLAESYLRNRAIRCEVPDCLRYHPRCWHGPSATRHPALIARVERGERFCGVMRTYLSPAGGKADVEQNKLALGVCAGGAVRLFGGAGPLVVTEGIETGLSLVDGLEGRCGGVWACLGTKGLQAVELPPGCRELVVAADGDGPGLAAANALAARAAAANIYVRIMPAPEGLDWNDVARRTAA